MTVLKLKENFNYIEIAEFMNGLIGEISDGETWFWSYDTVSLKERIEIFKNCSPRILYTLSKKINLTDNGPMYLPCGGIAYFDNSLEISYLCKECGKVVGSSEQSQLCKDEETKWDAWYTLGGKGWDYSTGKINESSIMQ